MRNYLAANKLKEISKLSAFNIPEASRRKLNGHTTLYTFPDGSRLLVKSSTSRADCWHPDWKGRSDDIHLGPLKGVALRINSQGA